MASRRFTASLCTHSQCPYKFSGTVRQRWLHIHHWRKSSSLKMQKNIPGAVSLRDNNILLCKAKLGKSIHWVKKWSLLLQLSQSRVALRNKKEPQEQTHSNRIMGTFWSYQSLWTPAMYKTKLIECPQTAQNTSKEISASYPSELQLFHPKHLWPFPDLCAQRIYSSFKSGYFYILMLIKQKRKLSIKLL